MAHRHLSAPRTVTCKGCETVFETYHHRKVFCELRCKERYYDARRPIGRRCRYPSLCLECAQEFLGRVVDQTFCSNSCKSKNMARTITVPYQKGEDHHNWQGGKLASWLRCKYNISLEDFFELQEQQGGVCAICGGTGGRGDPNRRLAVDHHHESGRVRGLLCGNCNLAIGLMKDDPERLVAAAEYLRITSEPGDATTAA